MSEEGTPENPLLSIISIDSNRKEVSKELDSVLEGCSDSDSIFVISESSSLAPLMYEILRKLANDIQYDNIYLFDSFMSGETKPVFNKVTNLFYCSPRTFWEKVDACKLENRIFVTFNKPAEVHLPLTVGERCINFVFRKSEDSEELTSFPSLITSFKKTSSKEEEEEEEERASYSSLKEGTSFRSPHNSALLKVAETLIRYRTFCWSKKLDVRFKGKGERLSAFDMVVIFFLFYELPIGKIQIENVWGGENDGDDVFTKMFINKKGLENNFYYENIKKSYASNPTQIIFGKPHNADTFDLFVYVGEEREEKEASMIDLFHKEFGTIVQLLYVSNFCHLSNDSTCLLFFRFFSKSHRYI